MTLPEVLIVVAIMGIMLAIGLLYLKPAEAPLQAGSLLLEGVFRQARLQAIATTSAYRVSPSGTGGLEIEFAASCSDSTWAGAPNGNYELPSDVTLDDTSWSVCFTSRGIATTNVVIQLNHPDFGSRQVEVLLGGTTRVL